MSWHGDFLTGYLECALWSSSDDDGEPYDGNFSISDFSEEARTLAEAECARFHKENADDLSDSGIDPALAGHNFWLTRNHHGSGFWDEDEIAQQFRDRLTAGAHRLGECSVYQGDDGKLEFCNG